jgi:cysteine dioxygenase
MLKVVLIKWSGHESSNLHGHKKGGCIFKVLHGKVKEERYPNLTHKKLLSKCTYHPGNVAYIDDRMGLHIVKNPSAKVAMSIHLYTPGSED